MSAVYRPTGDWAEYLRLAHAGVNTRTAATLVLEQIRRRRRTTTARRPREHGTERGFRQHRHDRTPVCGACGAAHSRHNTDTRATRAAA